MSSTSFKEIEHKFVVDSHFDEQRFLADLKNLAPTRTDRISVRDTYFVLQKERKHVVRHRFDNQIQQLTIKSVEGDAAVRTEINLPIDQSKGDQKNVVEAFMNTLGCSWSGEIRKDIEVAYFPDCEVVFYRAVGRSKTVHCVEFEAISPKSVDAGLATLDKYEEALGFAGRQRELKSLFELLLLEDAPAEVRALFA